MREAPAPCRTGALVTVMKMMNFAEVLQQLKVTYCVVFTLASGRPVAAYVQDVLVPGLNTDVGIGRPVEIYADFIAFQVTADRSRNVPMLIVNRFEPQ
jgi:hypothetical protein